MSEPEFVPYPKMARLSRDIIITEKIDGTNACVYVGEDGGIRAGCRSRWLTPTNDNYAFAAWVEDHRDELLTLGPGRHFGEWWGRGIQRHYDIPDRRFSMFNVERWCLHGETPQPIQSSSSPIIKMQDVLPACCSLVPMMSRSPFHFDPIEWALQRLKEGGSLAAPGFTDPEGIVVFHVAAGIGFKKTIYKNDAPKARGKE